MPPFIHVYVSFSLDILQSSQHLDTRGAPGMASVHIALPQSHLRHLAGSSAATLLRHGAAVLERSPKGIKPAKFAKAGTIEAGGGGEVKSWSATVRLGRPNPVSPTDVVRRFRLIPGPYQVFDEATAIGSAGETCLGDSSSPTFLAPLPESGRKRRPMVAISEAFEPPNCRTGKKLSGPSRQR